MFTSISAWQKTEELFGSSIVTESRNEETHTEMFSAVIKSKDTFPRGSMREINCTRIEPHMHSWLNSLNVKFSHAHTNSIHTL